MLLLKMPPKHIFFLHFLWVKVKTRIFIYIFNTFYICIDFIYMISIQQMQYIVVLSEEQQFQRASERCFVTQPTLSMQLKKAEEQLGYLVFDRESNPIRLTPSGEKLLPILREILSENEKIKHLSDQLKGNVKEEIRIGIIPTVASYLIPRLFGEWQKSFDALKLTIHEMKTVDVLEAMERKELDIGIIAGPHADPRLRSIPLFQEEICIYAPSVERESVSLLDLQEMHPWLLNQGNCLRTQMIHFCQLSKQKDENEWNYEGGNLPLIIEMVDRHQGYTLIPSNFPLSKVQQKGIKTISGLDLVPAREIIALCSNRSGKMNGIEALARSIQFAFGQSTQDKQLQVLDWK
jgi:LysR family hydrogen peroxide-inducible transcriptional activator